MDGNVVPFPQFRRYRVCPSCGHMLHNIEVTSARFDFDCPECGEHPLSDFELVDCGAYPVDED